ncbi:hypothetical protein [Streptomyces sp. NPDC006999]
MSKSRVQWQIDSNAPSVEVIFANLVVGACAGDQTVIESAAIVEPTVDAL